jgi:hypothetical protein
MADMADSAAVVAGRGCVFFPIGLGHLEGTEALERAGVLVAIVQLGPRAKAAISLVELTTTPAAGARR